MGKYYLTNKAVDDLSDIWNYTFNKWSERQADNYYSMLIETFQSIANKPDLGKNYEGIVTSLFGIHSNRHIVFYRIINSCEIEITRILHESMDLKKRIFE